MRDRYNPINYTNLAGKLDHGNLLGLSDTDHSAYVPYTGATGDVDLGANQIFATKVGIGTIIPDYDLHIVSTGNENNLRCDLYADNAACPAFDWRKARGTISVPTIVQNGDRLGRLLFRGYDGDSWVVGGRIDSNVDGVPSDGSMPGRMSFWTSDGATVLESVRITSEQKTIINPWSGTFDARLTVRDLSGNPQLRLVEDQTADWCDFQVDGDGYLTITPTGSKTTFSGNVNITGLTASQAVMTDASKNLVSVDYLDQAVKTTSTPQFAGLGVGIAYDSTRGLNVYKSTTGNNDKGCYVELKNTLNDSHDNQNAGYFQAGWYPDVGSVGAQVLLSQSGATNLNVISLNTTETQNYSIFQSYATISQFSLTGSTTGGGIATITNAYDYYAANAVKVNANTSIGALYAFYDAGMTAGTTNWGMAINTNSYINASLSIGKNTAPAAPLDVVGAGIFTGDAKALSFTIGANTLTTSEWAFLDGQDQAVKQASAPTFAGLNTPELYNSAGDLKIMPDVQGNVVLFGDTDIGAGIEGKSLYIYRMAAAGDDSIRMYVNSAGHSYIMATDNLYVGGDNVAAGFYYSGGFGILDNKEFNFGNDIDYTMGYVSATDTFNIVDGGSLTASIRAFLNSSGYWHFPERVRIGSAVAPTVALDVTGAGLLANDTTTATTLKATKNVATVGADKAVADFVQDSTTGACEVLRLQQDDASEEFVDFVGTDGGATGADSGASIIVALNGTKYKLKLYATA